MTVVAFAGAGTAWALRGSSGPAYRTALVQRADVSQTVDADGTLTARRTATLAFPTPGTVNSVRVTVGEQVRAGQLIATIDPTALQTAVIDAKAQVARAQQKLAHDEDAQATTSSSSFSTSSRTASSADATPAASSATATSAAKSTVAATERAPTSSSSSLRHVQAAVVAAQQAVDAALTDQDAAINKVGTACAATGEPTPLTSSTTADADGRVVGTAGSAAALITVRNADGSVATTTSANPLHVSAVERYTFTGLQPGTVYTLQVVRTAVVNTDTCESAITAVGAGQRTISGALAQLKTALAALTPAVAKVSTSSAKGASSPGAPSVSRAATSPSQSSGSRGSTATGSNSTGTTVTVTAQQIAADAKGIDATKAYLAVAQRNLTYARLTTPVAGTVAAVGVTKGVPASSSSTITVVGSGALSVDVSVPLADIDLVKMGERAAVTVDGRSTPLAGKVTLVGSTNSSSSTGSSSTYTVTMQLDRKYANLYDGMGASVAIAVGSAKSVLTVPISAVHTNGRQHTVEVLSGGAAVTRTVLLGRVGTERVQVTSGLQLGEKVILADLDAGIPSSNDLTRRRSSTGSLTGLTGGTGPGGGFGGGFGGAGGPRGR